VAARNMQRVAWYAGVFGLGAGALYWALAPGAEHTRPARASVHAAASGTAHLQEVTALARAEHGAAPRLVAAYDDWAAEPDALAARKAALDALFAEPNLPKKLSSVLEAVEADPTPPERDPLWQPLVASLADVWRGDALNHGLDLMIAETRPRARRALISSFAWLANSPRARELSPAQSQTLGNDFIDLYQQLPASQKPEVLSALRNVAGRDAADILEGRSSELERQYQRALEDTQALSQKAAQNSEQP